MKIQQSRGGRPASDYGIDEIGRFSNELDEIVRRPAAVAEGDDREAVNLRLAHAMTCACNHHGERIPTTMEVITLVAERILGQANVVGTRH